VAPQLVPLLGPHTQVLTAMNGVPWWFFEGLPGRCHGLTLASTAGVLLMVSVSVTVAPVAGGERTAGRDR
jgi:ketopantoate reductase